MIDDGKLIEGCLRNKRRSQKQLYNKYAPKMYGVCLRYSKNKHDAEDILQDAFIKIYRNIDFFNNKGSFEGWIRRIVVNTALTHLRNKTKHWFVDIDTVPVAIEEDEEKFSPLSPEDLIQLIQELPNGYRTVINLFVFEKYSHKEIAKALAISEGTSKSQYSKAKALLKSKIEEKIKREKPAI